MLAASARSMARAMVSPTTHPMLPPINANSMTLRTTLCGPRLPRAFITASLRPVSRRAFSSRSRYGLMSTNSSGSVDTSSRSTSSYPGSSRLAMRLRASRRRWCPHFGQTWRLASRSALKSNWPQPSHFCQSPSVRTLFSAVLASISFSCRLNQDMHSLSPRAPRGSHRCSKSLEHFYSWCDLSACDFVQLSG